MPRPLTKREYNILILTVIMAFIYLTYNGLIRPLREQIVLVEQQIDARRRELNKDFRTIRKADALEEEYNVYLNRFKQTQTNEQVMSSILAEIEKIAREINVNIFDLKPKKVKINDAHNYFSVSLTINSDFISIIHFLYILQKQEYLFNVEKLSFNKKSRGKTTAIKTNIVLSKIKCRNIGDVD